QQTTPILHQMPMLQLTSLLQYFNITQHTWARQDQSSQLDDIWVTPNILTNVSGLNIVPSTGTTDSDHAILHTKWMLPQAFTMWNKKKLPRKRYLYHKMIEEGWKDFSFYIID
ncbi:2218_t:CDS:1, partial [Gigaspora margarita]